MEACYSTTSKGLYKKMYGYVKHGKNECALTLHTLCSRIHTNE